MNIYGIRAIYHFEMARTFRTLWESIAAPVLTTSLYFIVFGKAIGSRMGDIDSVSYGAFIIPGLVMLNLLNESITNAFTCPGGLALFMSCFQPRFRGSKC